jgi:amidase
MLKKIRKEGVDKIMDENKLDALIAPTGTPAWKTDLINGDNYLGSSSSYAAISGYPSITVPMGFIDELPVGISFFGRAWSEPILLEIAYSFEQGTKQRKAPRFLN